MQTINMVITFVLGVFAFLGYLGIRDISTIKKEYLLELSKLKETKDDFERESNVFHEEKIKIQNELKSILEVNNLQNDKIKFIELKEKVSFHIKKNNPSLALQYANAALEVTPDDPELIYYKAQLLLQMNQTEAALEMYKAAHELNPEDAASKLNYVECLFIVGVIDKARSIIKDDPELFRRKGDGRLLRVYDAIEFYHDKNEDGLREVASSCVNANNAEHKRPYMKDWSMDEIRFFLHYEPDSDVKKVFAILLSYWEGKIDGATMLAELNLPVPGRL